MKRQPEIRRIRHDDLRGVFLLGGELFVPGNGGDLPLAWNEAHLAGVLADDMAHSFVAAGKKSIEGFLIGRISSADTAEIVWTGARGREGARLLADLHQAFIESLPPTVTLIRLELHESSTEMIDFFGKFGFTLSKHVVIMENFFRKKS
jgi:hypothetical protein